MKTRNKDCIDKTLRRHLETYRNGVAGMPYTNGAVKAS